MATKKTKPVSKEVTKLPQAVPAVTLKPTSSATKFIIFLIVTLSADIFLWVMYRTSDNDSVFINSPLVMLIFTLIMSPFLIFYTVKYLIKLIKIIFKTAVSKPKIFFPVLAGVIIVIFLISFIVKKTEYSRLQNHLKIIQDQMASAAYIKSIGDSIFVTSKPVPEGWDAAKIQTVSSDSQYYLFDIYYSITGTKIEEYYYSTLSWLLDIQMSTESKVEWDKALSSPPDFLISLNNQDFNSAIESSLSSIMSLKEFSELAILNNDKEAMRDVEARLLVQLHWLENLSYSTDAGFFAEWTDIPIVYAAEARSLRGCYGFLPCTKLPETIKRVQGVWHSVHNYTVGEPSATSTTDSWTSLESDVHDYGYPITGAGLQVGADEITKTSPTLDAFNEECHSKGGIVGGSGGVMTNLPVTRNGYQCWSDNGNCWDLLTYSGERYKGGGNNCEKLNLVPDRNIFENIAAEFDIVDDAIVYSFDSLTDDISNIFTTKWDGDYSITYSGSACSGLPRVPGMNANTYLASYLNSYSSINVSGNSITGFSNGGIDKDGNASAVVNFAGYGATISMRMDLQFTESGNSTVVNGTMYFTSVISGVNIQCSSNVSGTKN